MQYSKCEQMIFLQHNWQSQTSSREGVKSPGIVRDSLASIGFVTAFSSQGLLGFLLWVICLRILAMFLYTRTKIREIIGRNQAVKFHDRL